MTAWLREYGLPWKDYICDTSLYLDKADARPQYVHRTLPQNTGGHQVQNKLAPVVDHGMSGVVAALVAHNNFVFFTEQIDHPALALKTAVILLSACPTARISRSTQYAHRNSGMFLGQNAGPGDLCQHPAHPP